MAKKNTTTFYTVSGYCRIKGCLDSITCKEIFPTRAKAAQHVADEINYTIEEENAQNPDDQMELVKAKDCTNGYELSAYNDADDVVAFQIVEHKMEPIHAMVTFDQDERTLNITTFKSKKDAEQRVATCAKSILRPAEAVEYIYADRNGQSEIEVNDIQDREDYIHAETTNGNFLAWTAVEIPVGKTADITVQ